MGLIDDKLPDEHVLDKNKYPFGAPPFIRKPYENPNLIGRLKGKHVRIDLHNGETLDGVIQEYNQYEILLREDDSIGPIVVYKNFIAVIIPSDDNPFMEKENVRDTNNPE